MPERDNQAGHSARLLRGLVWAGVVLAPIAAAVVLIGGSSSTVRFAVLLIAVSVVLIGASVLVRSDPVLLRMDVEDRVAQEVDAMRRELRAEFATAVAAPAPEADSRPPLTPRNPDGRAQVYGGGFEPEPEFVPQQEFAPQQEFVDRTTFVHQPEPVVYAAQPETGYGYDESAYDESAYDESGYGYDGGYQDEHPYEPEVPVRATGGRASVPGIVHPVSPAQSQGFTAQTSQGFPAQTSQGFPAQGGVPVPAGRASAAVPPAPVARASAAASVPVAPIGQPVPRPRAAAAVPPPPGPNGMMAAPGPNGMMAPPARAAASVRPGTQYGRPEAPDDDFGATNGYAGANDYNDPDTSAEYKARRHRPSANDTNVGTLADFANYPGYDSSAQNW
jgi:hypothetical protein